MAKRAAVDMLERWIDLDRVLASGDGLDVPRFARRWGVDVKTVLRDLKAFETLGQGMHSFRREGERRETWYYDRKAQPLFARNVPD